MNLKPIAPLLPNPFPHSFTSAIVQRQNSGCKTTGSPTEIKDTDRPPPPTRLRTVVASLAIAPPTPKHNLTEPSLVLH
ncbi:MAG: hypothetical protein MUF49_22630 [Oculatellaceae cyanobacterium Prado106]|nr:hypothetical protein [Oculatellaceae cyanobacterium Prado106]